MQPPDVEQATPRSGFLVGPWQFVVVVLLAPWLLVATAPTDDPAERWLLVGLGGTPIVILLVVFGRGLALVGERGLWTPSRGWTPWCIVVEVQIEQIDERLLPIEAPVLRLDVPVTQRGPGSREQLTGLAGYRLSNGNRRVWRQANRLCHWAQLPPLPYRQQLPPSHAPRRARRD